MFRDIVLQDTQPQEWPAVRERIHARVMASMGTAPDAAVDPCCEVVEEYERYGLRHRKIRYRAMPDEYGLAVIVLPEGAEEGDPKPAVIVCHGTDAVNGKYNVLSLDERPNRAYAIELAQRGFVTVAPDCYEFGELLTRGAQLPQEEIHKRYRESLARFPEEHPDWSLDGRRLWDHQRLLDALDRVGFIRPGAYGVIGNSLGGRTAIFLAAFEERIAAAVPSTGISPNLTNIYRSGPGGLEQYRKRSGHTLYDYQDMIALCAPRPMLVLEPFNDPYNPYIEANFRCFTMGQRAYQLLGKPECFCALTHGDGHDTTPHVREFAYRWFERWLKQQP
jgi:dienelactone hydrolase